MDVDASRLLFSTLAEEPISGTDLLVFPANVRKAIVPLGPSVLT